MTKAARSSASRRRRQRWAWGVLLVSCGVLVYPAIELASAAVRQRQQRTLLRMLHSPQPVMRKQGAWLTPEYEQGRAIEFIAQQVAGGTEGDADVRECYVYALGRTGDQRYFGLIAEVLAADPSGYVRQAAWLALARLDAERFIALAEARPPPEDLWDQIGRAIGRLEAGDVRDVPKLLQWARTAADDQRLVVCAALYRGLRPLLEAAGRWPLGKDVAEGQLWPPALLEAVEQRIAAMDLQRLASDTRPHLAAASLVQRNTYRMTNARNWIAWLLSRF